MKVRDESWLTARFRFMVPLLTGFFDWMVAYNWNGFGCL